MKPSLMWEAFIMSSIHYDLFYSIINGLNASIVMWRHLRFKDAYDDWCFLSLVIVVIIRELLSSQTSIFNKFTKEY